MAIPLAATKSMNRKIVYIILMALFIVLLMALLWWWFLGREKNSLQQTGTFGTAQNVDGKNGTGGANGQTNIGNALPGQTTGSSGIAGSQGTGGSQLGEPGTSQIDINVPLNSTTGGTAGTQTGGLIATPDQPGTSGVTGTPGTYTPVGTVGSVTQPGTPTVGTVAGVPNPTITTTTGGGVTPTTVGGVAFPTTTNSGVVIPTSVGPVVTVPGGGTVTNPDFPTGNSTTIVATPVGPVTLPGATTVGTSPVSTPTVPGTTNPPTVPTPVLAVTSSDPGQIGVPGVVWLAGVPVTGTAVPVDLISYVGLTPLSTTTFNPPATPTPPVVTSVSNRTNSPGTVFNPTGINQIAGSNPTGNGGILPNIGTNDYGQQTGSQDGLGVGGTLAITAGAGAIACGAVQALQALGLTTGSGSILNPGASVATAPATAAQAKLAVIPPVMPLSVSTYDLNTNTSVSFGLAGLIGLNRAQLGLQQSSAELNDFWGCIARTIAKVALNQITNSVVNWINSGFQGSPSFVQNPTKFIQQTADQAAGAFIQSSALSFLCSPFQLQIRIAIAKSYASRSAAPTCTLTQVSSNINNFMRGLFSKSGGWPAFIQFTTVPTNNPYGAFLYGSIGVGIATNNARGQLQQDLLQGQGFLSFKQKQNCRTTSTPPAASPTNSITEVPGPSNDPNNPTAPIYSVCDLVVTTPGTVIQNALVGTNNSTLNSLNLAKSFDEILSALLTQLLTRTLQGGLSNLSGAGGYASTFYTPDQLQAQSQVTGMMTQFQNDTSLAQQYASVQQNSIQDIQVVQGALSELYNCWSTIATSSTYASFAATGMTQASTTLNSYYANIDAYNNRILLANNAISVLEQLQSRTLSAGSTNDLSAITADYNANKAAGIFPTQTDLNNAQQSRTTLQSQLSITNNQTQTSLQQCYAIP